MTLLLEIACAVGFFVLIMASIALHEVGHLLPGKLFGVKITQYFVGFGKTLWKVRRGETEYGVKLLPLGGYVRLVGMYPLARDIPAEGARARPVSRLATAAREAEADAITPADEGRLFYQKKTWQKIIIMAGGPLMNILIAFGLFWAITGLHGQYRPTMVVAEVQQCVVPADRGDTVCRPGDPPTPAVRAGAEVGDVVVALNGRPVASWDELTTLIRANTDKPATLTVERAGRRVDLATVPTMITGVPDRLDPTRSVSAGFFGLSPGRQLVKGGPGTVIGDMGHMTAQSLVALVQFPVKVYHVAADLVLGHPRDVNGPMSIVGASRTAGEVAVAGQLPPVERVVVYGSLLASVNLFVALLNVVPLPPLDGGHIAGALYEGLRRVAARVRRRPDPGPVDTARMLPVAYAVGGFLLVAGAVLIVADIVSPVRLL